MDQWWLHLARELPGLGVLVWLVTYFLKHVRAVTDDNHRQYREAMEAVTKQCGTHQTMVVQAIEAEGAQTRVALDRNSNCLDKLNTQLHKLNGD